MFLLARPEQRTSGVTTLHARRSHGLSKVEHRRIVRYLQQVRDQIVGAGVQRQKSYGAVESGFGLDDLKLRLLFLGRRCRRLHRSLQTFMNLRTAVSPRDSAQTRGSVLASTLMRAEAGE